MLEGFRFQAAAGAGGIRVGGPPGWVGGQVALPGSHLVDSPSNELTQAHERPWVYRGRVQVVPRGWEKGGPLREECLSYPLLQGGVGAVHQGLGREDGGGGAHEVGVDHRHSRQPECERYRPMSHRVYGQVVPYWRDGPG